jgi:DNA-binding winged helix-turn-helix (wHTH) protein
MPLETQVLYEFGGFRLNPADHSLVCDGKPVPLTPKSFEILVTLVERNGLLVTKDELMKRIWPDSFVEEANLSVNVSALRKALGDTTEHQEFIETVPKLGYRFIAPVKPIRHGSSAEVASISEGPRERAIPQVDETKQSSFVALPAAIPAPPPSHTKEIRLGLFALVAVAIGLAGLGYWLSRKEVPKARVAAEPRRLAILPFRNIKKDPGSDFLGYSLADAVITKMGFVRVLRLRPSYAVEKYRD